MNLNLKRRIMYLKRAQGNLQSAIDNLESARVMNTTDEMAIMRELEYSHDRIAELVGTLTKGDTDEPK